MNHLPQTKQRFSFAWRRLGCLVVLLLPLASLATADEIVYESGWLTVGLAVAVGSCRQRPVEGQPARFVDDLIGCGQAGQRQQEHNETAESPPREGKPLLGLRQMIHRFGSL